MASPLTVEPNAGAAAPLPVATIAPQTNVPAPSIPEEAASPALPDELISIPAIRGVVAGDPGAVSASIEEFTQRPEGQLISENQGALQGAGIGLYRSLDGGLGVLFNSQVITDVDLQNADKEGRLTEIAPPFDQVNAALGQNLSQGAAAAAGGPALAPPASIGALPDSSAAPSRKAIMAKIANLAPQGPTSGAQPGAGRLINEILKPVI